MLTFFLYSLVMTVSETIFSYIGDAIYKSCCLPNTYFLICGISSRCYNLSCIIYVSIYIHVVVFGRPDCRAREA